MNAAAPMLALAGIATIAIVTARRPMPLHRAAPSPALPPPKEPQRAEATIALITREANALGVDPRIAVAFADRESGLNPNAEGDLRWPFNNHGEQFRKYVLESEHLAQNPYRSDPSLWHSYGLFQLLAPFHVLGNEHPRALLDPSTNVQRGVRAVRGVLQKSAGNLYEARRLYVGCGPDSGCSPTELARIDAAWTEALRKWRLA